jgi:hypothetical protein
MSHYCERESKILKSEGKRRHGGAFRKRQKNHQAAGAYGLAGVRMLRDDKKLILTEKASF